MHARQAMNTRLLPEDLDKIPRLGWISTPSPITALPELAAELGLDYAAVKRDDLGDALLGGTKPRKLDYLLASPPFADAPRWIAVGAIGSGNSAALGAAAQKLERGLDAYAFWTMISPGVLENLAYLASSPATIHYQRSRTTLALRHPTIFLAQKLKGVPIVPPGSTNAIGMLGLVRAGLELGAQINAGILPKPDAIYLAFGSGGTAVGLRVGLALAGLETTIIAVTVVERILSGQMRVRSLEKQLAAELAKWKIPPPKTKTPLVLERSQSGMGYAIPTLQALAACEKMAAHNIPLEPIYTAKAMAALLEHAKKLSARKVLFWLTLHRKDIPQAENWQSKLPPALARRVQTELSKAKEHDIPAQIAVLRNRRRLITLGAVGLLGLGIGVRITGYPPLNPWTGQVLAPWEAHILRCAAEALLPPDTDEQELNKIPAGIDAYLSKMPQNMLLEVHAMLALIEHGTTPLGLKLHRFSLLSPEEREAFLSSLANRGGLLAQAYCGIRDLCLLGHYQNPTTWKDLGYEGPRVALNYDPKGPERLIFPAYESLIAKPGELPRGMVQ